MTHTPKQDRPQFKVTVHRTKAYWPFRWHWTMATWKDKYIDSGLTFRKPTYDRVLEFYIRSKKEKVAEEKTAKETEEILL